MESSDETPPRPPLTKGRILEAAVDLADRDGLHALTMRRLGAELGVEAMALYKHVAGKDEILDGIVELVVAEIETPSGRVAWKEAMRRRAISAREVLSRHSWAIGLLETRGAKGPAAMRYLDAILGSLRSAGFSIENAANAFWMLDSYVYGHVVQEASLALRTSQEMTASSGSDLEQITQDEYPYLDEVALRSGYSFDNLFEFGLDLILDSLERTRISASD